MDDLLVSRVRSNTLLNVTAVPPAVLAGFIQSIVKVPFEARPACTYSGNGDGIAPAMALRDAITKARVAGARKGPE